MSDVRLIADAKNSLGEGPVFVARENALRWVDILGRRWHRFNLGGGELTAIDLAEGLTAFAPRQNGGFVGTFESGFATFDDRCENVAWIARPELTLPANRFNDGGTDPRGRFLAGSMNKEGSGSTGSLYVLDPAIGLRKVKSEIGISNSIAFSPDGTVLYFADTAANDLGAYAYDAAAGTIGARLPFGNSSTVKGYPDGSAVDRDGYLWNARWDGWCITRFAPDGTLDRIIDLPVQRPTCCAFGGSELKTLYITTAIGDLTEVALRGQPWAGGLLAIDVDVPGLPRASYRE